MPSNFIEQKTVEGILSKTKTTYDSRIASLYALICSKSKHYEAERFIYLWMAFNGMYGYFFSFLVTHLLNFLLSIRRLLKITGKVISLSVPLLTFAAMGVSIFIASHVYQPVARGISVGVIFICMLFLLQVLKKEDLIWVKGFVTSS